MKSNKILSLCLMGLGLYVSQDIQASNPAYEATVNAKHGLGGAYDPSSNPAYNATVNAKHGLGSQEAALSIKGVPYSHWAGFSGFYYPNNTAKLTKNGATVWFDNVKKVSFASMIFLGRPYVKFATDDQKTTFYGIPRK